MDSLDDKITRLESEIAELPIGYILKRILMVW